MVERKSALYQENPAPMAVRYAKEVCDVAVLPMGAIEQHGPHCPLMSDAANAMGMAKLIGEKSGAMVLPCPMYGSHPAHHWGVPGTIPLRFETHIELIIDIVRGASIAGYNKFLLLSAHGQVPATAIATQKLGIEGFYTISFHWYDFLRDNKTELEDHMWHADEAETSVALFLYPELVDMSLAGKGKSENFLNPGWVIPPGMAPKPGQMYYFEGTFSKPEKYHIQEGGNGILGDATKATVEKGEKLVMGVVEHACRLIAEIREKYPPGVKPRTN